MSPLSNRDDRLRQVLVRAVASPASIFLVTAGLLLVASPVMWPLGAAALVLDGAWLWLRIRDPGFVRASGEETVRQRWLGLIQSLEAVAAGLDRDTAAALTAIVESQERLMGMYATGANRLPDTRFELISLTHHCLSLAEKRRHLQHYLGSVRSQQAQRQAAQLQVKVEQSQDPVTRQLYEQALDQKRQELENYVRVSEAIARIDGQLAAVQCTFDNMLSRVVRMQTADAVTADPDPVLSELSRLKLGIASLEASLNETLTLRGAA